MRQTIKLVCFVQNDAPKIGLFLIHRFKVFFFNKILSNKESYLTLLTLCAVREFSLFEKCLSCTKWLHFVQDKLQTLKKKKMALNTIELFLTQIYSQCTLKIVRKNPTPFPKHDNKVDMFFSF